MVLIDTSVWIEFFRGHDPYFDKVRAILEIRGALASDVVFGEILQGCKDPKEARFVEEFYGSLPKAHLPDLFIEAGKLSLSKKAIHKGVGLIDISILALAQHHHAKIWTLDKKFMAVIPEGMQYQR